MQKRKHLHYICVFRVKLENSLPGWNNFVEIQFSLVVDHQILMFSVYQK